MGKSLRTWEGSKQDRCRAGRGGHLGCACKEVAESNTHGAQNDFGEGSPTL